MTALAAILRPALEAIARAYRSVLFWAGAGAMAVMMTVVVVQIFCRYLLGFSLFWSEELCQVLLVWITFLFAGRALDAGEIIAVDFVIEPLNRWARLVALLLGSGAALAVLIMLTVLGYRYAAFNWSQINPALQISQFWTYLAVPVGFGLFAAHLACRTLSRFLEILGEDGGTAR